MRNWVIFSEQTTFLSWRFSLGKDNCVYNMIGGEEEREGILHSLFYGHFSGVVRQALPIWGTLVQRWVK